MASKKEGTNKLLWHFDRNVPHWFLSPWFPKFGGETDAWRERRIYEASQIFEADCLYALGDKAIEINPDWEDYLVSNSLALRNFCLHNLAFFLQKRNPASPNILNNLIEG